MSAFTAAAAAAALRKRDNNNNNNNRGTSMYNRTKELNLRPGLPAASLGLYESQKCRDWNTFQQYLRDHRPSLELSSCSGSDVVEFLRHLDQFGESKVHNQSCPRFGTCACPTRQGWGSLDAIIRRLHAAFEENGGTPEMNPFGARAVKMYLREVRDSDQDKARGKSCVCF